MYTMQLMDYRVAEAREINPRLRALVLINQASANPRHRALGVAIESLREGSRNLTVADTVIRDRVAYQRSHLLGQTVPGVRPPVRPRGRGDALSVQGGVLRGLSWSGLQADR